MRRFWEKVAIFESEAYQPMWSYTFFDISLPNEKYKKITLSCSYENIAQPAPTIELMERHVRLPSLPLWILLGTKLLNSQDPNALDIIKSLNTETHFRLLTSTRLDYRTKHIIHRQGWHSSQRYALPFDEPVVKVPECKPYALDKLVRDEHFENMFGSCDRTLVGNVLKSIFSCSPQIVLNGTAKNEYRDCYIGRTPESAPMLNFRIKADVGRGIPGFWHAIQYEE